jgi:hypothetical protein
VQSCDQFAGKLQKDVPARQFEMNEKGILKFSIKTQSAFYLKKQGNKDVQSCDQLLGKM